jgi:hypothetical protein
MNFLFHLLTSFALPSIFPRWLYTDVPQPSRHRSALHPYIGYHRPTAYVRVSHRPPFQKRSIDRFILQSMFYNRVSVQEVWAKTC